jgi:hypothetical protein
MKAIRILSKVRPLSLVLLAVALSPCWARAQAVSGEFKLPYEVQWAKLILSPGEYTFSIQSMNLPCPLVLKRQSANQTPVMLLASGISKSTYSSGHSGLKLALIGERRTVESLRLDDLGLVLYYGKPSGKRYTAMASVPSPAVQVPVVASGH